MTDGILDEDLYQLGYREDNITLICPDCGTREALESTFGIGKDEQDHILQAIHGGSNA